MSSGTFRTGAVFWGILLPLLHTTPLFAEFSDFVQARGDQLLDGNQVYRFVSWNVPNLLVIEDSFEFLGNSPWRWPNEFEIRDALRSVQQMGGQVARTYVITVQRADSNMGEYVHVIRPGIFNEQAFRTLDRVLQIANQEQIRLIIPLVDQWKWMGGIEQYAAFRGKTAAEFWTDPEIIADFKQTIHYVLNRRNTLTGTLYKDDKAILAWETGNEIDAPPAWTCEIAAYLKLLDPRHLVVDGKSLRGLPLESLSDSNVDVLTTHHYPHPGTSILADIRQAASVTAGKKPYFVGEFGFLSVAETEQVLELVERERIAGALYWSLRFHRRDGGFYWHFEPAGGNLYKALHWPGFASGAAYAEQPVIDLLCRSAWGIRGLPVPPPPQPAPAHLLPITHPGRITWRGSTGASSYAVQRATDSAGPWEILATEVSDAEVQYRPLFCDSTVVPGEEYFYRVLARNQSGVSEPSNLVGPIRVHHRMLVDEFTSDSENLTRSGPMAARSDLPRRTQEDSHRLALEAGACLTYQLAGPVQGVRAFVFSSAEPPRLEVSLSPDGQEFTVATPIIHTTDWSAGDYGYLTPCLLETTCAGSAARYVRLRVPDKAKSAELQLSRIEIDFAPIPIP